MVKLFIKLLILALIVLGAVMLVRDDPGFVMLRYRGWNVETTLAAALAALIVLTVVIHYLIRRCGGARRTGATRARSGSSTRA